MNAIVTGGRGFVGTNLCKKLVSLQWSVISFDDLSTGSASEIDLVEYHNLPLSSAAFQNAVRGFRPNVIFHLAAVPRVSYSVEHPLSTTSANVIGTLHVLDAVRLLSPKTIIVNSSSSSVYGGADELPTKESCPMQPKSPYAMQKLQAEQWCNMYHDLYGTKVVNLRYFNIFGPHNKYGGSYSTVLSAWLYWLYVDRKNAPFLEGDGTQSRDFCYIDNVIQANLLAAQNDQAIGKTFNIAQGKRHSLLDCKKILEDISGEKLPLEMRPPRVGDVKHTLADISLARNILGYNHSTNFVDQVKVMANWFENNYE